MGKSPAVPGTIGSNIFTLDKTEIGTHATEWNRVALTVFTGPGQATPGDHPVKVINLGGFFTWTRGVVMIAVGINIGNWNRLGIGGPEWSGPQKGRRSGRPEGSPGSQEAPA